jgi:hypothetical protein
MNTDEINNALEENLTHLYEASSILKLISNSRETAETTDMSHVANVAHRLVLEATSTLDKLNTKIRHQDIFRKRQEIVKEGSSNG